MIFYNDIIIIIYTSIIPIVWIFVKLFVSNHKLFFMVYSIHSVANTILTFYVNIFTLPICIYLYLYKIFILRFQFVLIYFLHLYYELKYHIEFFICLKIHLIIYASFKNYLTKSKNYWINAISKLTITSALFTFVFLRI